MKNSFKLTLLFLLGIFFYSNAQVTVGGGVNVNIDIPLPGVVIGKKRAPKRAPTPIPAPVPEPIPRPRRGHTNTGNHGGYGNHGGHTRTRNYHSLGNINNQNTPNGNYNYQVVNASINPENQGCERVYYALDNGETLELIIFTNNPNDYNYHYSHHHNNRYNNIITAILLNGQEIPVRDASISIQPRGHQGIHSVLNLHTAYDGDFNGTVNF